MPAGSRFSPNGGLRAAASQVLRPPPLTRTREDYGLFGPGSAVWEVWLYPTAYVAPLRAAIVQMFQPATAAGVSHNSVYQRDPLGRLRRTATYFITVVFGDGRAVVVAADRLRRVHDRVIGYDPVTGRRYAASDPENQLWVHMTTWHSVLYCYERYGPGPRPPEREAEFWRGCQIAAELQGLDPAGVPGSRAEVREYFASMRPRMCVSEGAREIIDWLRKPTSAELRPLKPVFALLARAAIATLPGYLRTLGGIDGSRVTDGAVVPLARTASRVMTLRSLRRIGAAASPEAYALRDAAAFGPPPTRPTTVTIAEARRRLDDTSPTGTKVGGQTRPSSPSFRVDSATFDAAT